MRKKLMKIVLLALTMAGILFACQHDFEEPEVNRPLTVDDAKAWYEANKPGSLILKSGNEGNTEKVVKPNWENASKFESENMEIVETSLMTQGGLGFFTAESKAEWEKSKNAGYISSISKLVIQKNKKTSESLGFIMTLVGDKTYQEKKGFDLSKSRYLQVENDFNGLVLFHDLDGNFVNGWRFTDGKVTRSVSALVFKNAPQLKLKAATTYDIYYWEQICTDWYIVSYVDGTEVRRTYSRTTCGSSYMVHGGSYTEYPITGTDPGSYGGSGGSSSGTTQTSTPTADKIISNYNNLKAEEKAVFENALKKFLTEGCAKKALVDSLSASKQKIGIKIDGNTSAGGYDPATKTITFNSISSVESDRTLFEELFHAYQDIFYYGGTYQYAKIINGKRVAGYVNIEFEAKLSGDLINTSCCMAIPGNAPANVRTDYMIWLDKIRNNGFKVDITEYATWLNKFRDYNPIYYSPFHSDLMSPRLFKSMSGSFCNFID